MWEAGALQFLRKWLITCRRMESILFSCVWNIMVNAHKQRWARMDGHTGFILISGVHGVLFYAEILPISFAFFVLVSSICTPRNWLLAQLIRCFYGYFLSCLSLMPSLEWKVCNQNQGRYTIRQVVWIHLQGQRSLVTFTAIAGSVDSAGGYRICFFSGMHYTIFTDKAEVASFVQILH